MTDQPDDQALLNVAFTAHRRHTFASTAGDCVCGYLPDTIIDWELHCLADVLRATATWIADRASPTLTGDPFILAADWAADLIREAVAADAPGRPHA